MLETLILSTSRFRLLVFFSTVMMYIYLYFFLISYSVMMASFRSFFFKYVSCIQFMQQAINLVGAVSKILGITWQWVIWFSRLWFYCWIRFHLDMAMMCPRYLCIRFLSFQDVSSHFICVFYLRVRFVGHISLNAEVVNVHKAPSSAWFQLLLQGTSPILLSLWVPDWVRFLIRIRLNLEQYKLKFEVTILGYSCGRWSDWFCCADRFRFPISLLAGSSVLFSLHKCGRCRCWFVTAVFRIRIGCPGGWAFNRRDRNKRDADF